MHVCYGSQGTLQQISHVNCAVTGNFSHGLQFPFSCPVALNSHPRVRTAEQPRMLSNDCALQLTRCNCFIRPL